MNQIATIAKFRAIRLLWGAVLRETGLPATPVRVHGTTAWRSLTRRDPYVNLLRATVAAFAAGVGGADSLTVLPYTQALGLPDPFARRLARNTQLILLEEANVHRVPTPAAGAGAVEVQTEGLSAAAWDLFRAIERKGGLAAALTSGWWQSEIATVAARRAKDVATRREPLTRTSEFPLLGQDVPEVLAPTPAAAPAASDLALEPHRLAEPFEALRDAAEAAGAPVVFLATLGRSPRSRRGRPMRRTSSKPAALPPRCRRVSPPPKNWSRPSPAPARSSPACAARTSFMANRHDRRSRADGGGRDRVARRDGPESWKRR